MSAIDPAPRIGRITLSATKSEGKICTLHFDHKIDVQINASVAKLAKAFQERSN